MLAVTTLGDIIINLYSCCSQVAQNKSLDAALISVAMIVNEGLFPTKSLNQGSSLFPTGTITFEAVWNGATLMTASKS